MKVKDFLVLKRTVSLDNFVSFLEIVKFFERDFVSEKFTFNKIELKLIKCL